MNAFERFARVTNAGMDAYCRGGWSRALALVVFLPLAVVLWLAALPFVIYLCFTWDGK